MTNGTKTERPMSEGDWVVHQRTGKRYVFLYLQNTGPNPARAVVVEHGEYENAAAIARASTAIILSNLKFDADADAGV